MGQPKPDRDPSRGGAGALGVDPANLLVVEDSPPGVEAATTAGCLTLILPGYGMISPDLAARAWRTIRHHDEILRLFDEYGSR